MFTGIITGVGRIAAVHDLGSSLQHGKRLTIEAPAGYLDDVGLGDSIALNGACMTVTTLAPSLHQFTIDISAESLDKTAGLAATGPDPHHVVEDVAICLGRAFNLAMGEKKGIARTAHAAGRLAAGDYATRVEQPRMGEERRCQA